MSTHNYYSYSARGWNSVPLYSTSYFLSMFIFNISIP